jgi:uncharacterized membrane protein
MDYLTVKWLHILSSTILFGAGVGSALHLVLATAGRNVDDIAATTKHVVVQDWALTATTAVFQPVSGFWMMHLAGIPTTAPWIRTSLWLYVFAIACWLPVVWMQIRMRNIAAVAAGEGTPLPRAWWRMFACWIVLGFFALAAFLFIFHLMVFKP